MRRRLVLTTVVAVAVAASTALPALAASERRAPSMAYRALDYANGQAMSILPPGANGLVNSSDLAAYEADGTRPPYSTDQRTTYDALNYGYPSLTDATLGSYYDDESFGVPAGQVIKTVTPATGVTIDYDSHDVPHVYGASDQKMAFGAGYAQASERLFLMDVLRHYGAGTTSAFLGPSCADEQMDHDELLLAPYTQAQGLAQVNALAHEYGSQGRRAVKLINGYVAGVNAYIAAANNDPSLLPADYGAAAGTNATPQPWTAADVVDIAGLIGGIFGKGGGIEVADSAFYSYLVKQLGTAGGQAAFNEFRSQNDPDAPTTITDQSFPYEQASTTPTALNVLPDLGSNGQPTVTGGPTDTTTGCDLTAPNVKGLATIASLGQLPKAFSNALVVNASHSADGHPIAVFGPQVSYYAPQILMEEDLHSPTYAAEGASFPGTGVVELGRGEDFAWSATSAGTDLVDQRLETVCDPGGGTPTANEPDYLYDGQCVPMTHETFSETATPGPGGLGAPVIINHEIYLTRHGVVQGWTTSGGKPVAIVDQRSTYGHDVDSVIGFLAWGTPKLTHDATSWMTGAGKIDYTFNWFYVDDKDDAYYVSGLDPIRPTNLDPDLPASGTGNAEWTGFLPFADHPHEIDPAQGYFVSWNNKPAPGFSAADDQYGYGESYRSQMLSAQIQDQFAAHGGLITRAELVQAMETAATQDLDGLTIVPKLLAYVAAHPAPPGTPPADQQMLAILQQWVADGAHRHKAVESDTQYDHAAAVAISDEMVPDLIKAVYDPLLSAGGTNSDGYDVLPMQWVNTPNGGGAHYGSAYDGGWEGYLEQTFQQLQGQQVGLPFTSPVTSTWCGSGPSSCAAAIWKAITTADNALVTANGGQTDPASWTASSATAATAMPPSPTNPTGTPAQTMPQYDAIYFRSVGIIGQDPIDWQNRPTFQQVIEFPSHRRGT